MAGGFLVMATQEACFAAICTVVAKFNDLDVGAKRKKIPQRTVGCTLLDLDLTYLGNLEGGYLVDVRETRVHVSDMRLICVSDDLIAIVDGDLKFSHAWSTGRIRLDASMRDLIRLRSLL
jgi:hypothetical protein